MTTPSFVWYSANGRAFFAIDYLNEKKTGAEPFPVLSRSRIEIDYLLPSGEVDWSALVRAYPCPILEELADAPSS